MIEPGERVLDGFDRRARPERSGRRSMITSMPSARAAAILP